MLGSDTFTNDITPIPQVKDNAIRIVLIPRIAVAILVTAFLRVPEASGQDVVMWFFRREDGLKRDQQLPVLA